MKDESELKDALLLHRGSDGKLPHSKVLFSSWEKVDEDLPSEVEVWYCDQWSLLAIVRGDSIRHAGDEDFVFEKGRPEERAVCVVNAARMDLNQWIYT